MKRIIRILCAFIGVTLLALSLASCTRKPGLYAWYGGRMNVENVFEITVDAGFGEQKYEVPFSLYRAVFLRNASNVEMTYIDGDNVERLVTNSEKTKAVKEFTEDEFTSYYALIALSEHFGVGLTSADTEAFKKNYDSNVAEYIKKVDESELKKGQTALEYAEAGYIESLAEMGMTKEFVEYNFYKTTLEKRVKEYLFPDIISYINQSYFHYKQVFIVYTRGDAADEQDALNEINDAYSALANGASIDELGTKYNNSEYSNEIYFDITGSIVGNKSGLTVTSIIDQTVKSLDDGETSGILMGDYDDFSSYYAIVKREPFSKDFILGNSEIATIIYSYPYTSASSSSAHYTTYNEYITMYEQNVRIEPINQKVYNRIAVNTLY